MKITVCSIAKSDKDCYKTICDRFVKMSSRWAQVEDRELFNSKITRAQELGEGTAQKAYEEILNPWLSRGLSVALDPKGKGHDTHAFAKMLADRHEVVFFIGGAYGHSETFLNRCDRVVTLSPLTMSHKVAKVVLFEQIYRALTILNGHPYHK